MGYFRVVLNGCGIRIAVDSHPRPIVGFYTTRIVRAASDSQASARAIELVRAQWSVGAEAKANKGGPPEFHTESVKRANFLEWLVFKNHGHTFYPEEEHAV